MASALSLLAVLASFAYFVLVRRRPAAPYELVASWFFLCGTGLRAAGRATGTVVGSGIGLIGALCILVAVILLWKNATALLAAGPRGPRVEPD